MATNDKSKAPAKPTDGETVFGDNVRASGALGSLAVKAGGLGVVSLGISAALGMSKNDGFRHFTLSYLTAFMWGLAICVGAVFWVTLQHLVNAKWSTALRRVGEVLASTAPVFGVLALPIVLPIFLGNGSVYVWADHAKVEGDHLLHHKAGYLNPGFFLVRFVLYFGFWTLLARFNLRKSLEQDKSTAPEMVRKRLQAAAGPSMILYGIAVTFCVIDLVMSLDPYWFSTIFGVYYFASCVLCINSVLVLSAMWLQNNGALKKSVSVEHFHDLGKMMFAFTVFWAYIGFSQFMLIWYANIPEETAWYKERFAHGWGDLSIALLVLHFIVPFFGLLSRHVKRNRKALAFWAFWILGVVYLDMYWLIMPATHSEDVPFGLIDITTLAGIAGVMIGAAAFLAKNLILVPVKDPRLAHSVAFENI